MEDRELIALYWNREERAIAETKSKYGAYCNTIAWNILHQRQDAEECENDTYLAAWNAIPPAKPTRLSAFLGRIARNIALDRYDYNTAKKRGEIPLILSELSEISSSQSLEQQFEEKDTVVHISAFLRTMNKTTRMVFLRRYWYADSIADIAKRFHMSESRVKSMLYRTRKKMRNYLEAGGITV